MTRSTKPKAIRACIEALCPELDLPLKNAMTNAANKPASQTAAM